MDARLTSDVAFFSLCLMLGVSGIEDCAFLFTVNNVICKESTVCVDVHHYVCVHICVYVCVFLGTVPHRTLLKYQKMVAYTQ